MQTRILIITGLVVAATLVAFVLEAKIKPGQRKAEDEASTN